MLNKFMVSGRLTADPKMQTVGENHCCKFSLACNRNADVIFDWFGKGDMVTIVGEVHINRYEKDGQKRNATEVKVEEIHFSGVRKNHAENSDDNDNLPF